MEILNLVTWVFPKRLARLLRREVVIIEYKKTDGRTDVASVASRVQAAKRDFSSVK
jgi:hypothetical protein